MGKGPTNEMVAVSIVRVLVRDYGKHRAARILLRAAVQAWRSRGLDREDFDEVAAADWRQA